jgi:hypothetical protein
MNKGFDTGRGIEVIVELLVVATVVALIMKKIRIPYTVALVIMGIAIGYNRLLLHLGLSTDVILLIFLPPLLFEGTLSMDREILKEKWREVLLLAFPVTFLSVITIGTVPITCWVIPGLLPFFSGLFSRQRCRAIRLRKWSRIFPRFKAMRRDKCIHDQNLFRALNLNYSGGMKA